MKTYFFFPNLHDGILVRQISGTPHEELDMMMKCRFSDLIPWEYNNCRDERMLHILWRRKEVDYLQGDENTDN